MAARKAPFSSPHAVGVLCFICLVFLARRSQTQAKTDPSEVSALNSIFSQWNLKASSSWNLSGEPCSGAAIDDTDFDNGVFNPTIKCDCSFDRGSTCHITHLKVYALDVAGRIPEELQDLLYLTNLQLIHNYLTGPLPSYIGNFSHMKYMNLGGNALSGPIPRELGNLQNLIILGLGTNNFSGPLPLELGNLTNLEHLYIDSAGFSGEIPSTFARLNKLEKLWASGNDFTSKIPDFIGHWTNLTVLLFQGNSFEGPIPPTFVNLTKMTDLRLGEITNGSSSLGFIRNMKRLRNLVLRDCGISDKISVNFTEFQELILLDLSFNNLTGPLPESLFSSSSLAYLFLGNNSLSGSLPIEKSPLLQTIDLSYNELSGGLPSWVTDEASLKLNLVANNFFINDTLNGVVPPGFYCLQRDIPCNRHSPIYNSFAVTCGSDVNISSDKTVYERDDKILMNAAYYVSDTNRWGVSSTGLYISNENSSAIFSTSLFSTARGSPSSLRYYGLGLEDQTYIVKLVFSEILFSNGSTWKSLGKRIFDIYIQGVRVERDFDIVKASGAPFKAVEKTYTAHVTDNFLEIHLYWAGKGTSYIPRQGTYGPLISSIRIFPDPAPKDSKNHQVLIASVAAVVVTLFLLVPLITLLWRKRRKRLSLDDEDEFSEITCRLDTFSYAELTTATDGFRPANVLGQGGFGAVFKGKLADGRVVAVKQLSVGSQQGKLQFLTEIATISAVQHRNLVKLYGCCIQEGRRLLVYEYLENKSLDQALFGKSGLALDWSTRFNICLGTARGLAYLHEESSVRIVHRDVKASNILLDTNLNPKISDFGLAKLYEDDKTHVSTRVAGTIGYLAPEYAMTGHLTEKVDVFGFGIVALEIVSGRPNSYSISDKQKVLLEWVWHLHENKCELDVIDPMLSSYDKEEAARVIGVGLLCTQVSPMLRPPMSRVVAMLVGDLELGEIASRPGYFTDWQTSDASSLPSDGFSCLATRGTLNEVEMLMDGEVQICLPIARLAFTIPSLVK